MERAASTHTCRVQASGLNANYKAMKYPVSMDRANHSNVTNKWLTLLGHGVDSASEATLRTSAGL